MSPGSAFSLFLFAASLEVGWELGIDNSVQEANLSCDETQMKLEIRVRRPLFQSARMFSKGRSHDRDCSNVFFPDPAQRFHLIYHVMHGDCGMQPIGRRLPGRRQRRSLSITVVFSFHPMFLTEVDRAYRLICNYGVASETHVSVPISISMLSTIPIDENGQGEMDCSYSVQIQRPTAPGVPASRFAHIGDKIFHNWRCNNLENSQFIWVHDCRVSPEFGEGEVILDQRGCTVDPVILGNLDYGASPHHKVHAVHHAYKFPDHPTLLFKCQISICDRFHPSCFFQHAAITGPPVCDNRRPRRSLMGNDVILRDDDVVFDIVSEPMTVLPIDNSIEPTDENEDGNSNSTSSRSTEMKEWECPCSIPLSLLLFSNFVLLLSLVIAALCWFKRKTSEHVIVSH